MSVDKSQEIKVLLQKHLKRNLTPEETQRLFDQLQNINTGDELDEVMRDRWGLNAKIKDMTNLSWMEIVAEKNKRADLSRMQNAQTMVRQVWQWGMAASLALIISLAFWWTWDYGPDYLTFTTGFGETRNIILNDGTSVILNANSRLTWNPEWKKDTARFAELKGEAFFDVAHVDNTMKPPSPSAVDGKRLPFQVKTSDLVIDVLGTAFNVSERRGETQVYLERGSIKLDLLDSNNGRRSEHAVNSQKDLQAAVSKSVMMVTGEMVEYSATSQKLQKIGAEKAESLTEWKEGSLVYHDIDFALMLQHLEDIYGKHFVVRDSALLDTKVSFGVPYKDWKTVKGLMELFLQIEITPNENDQITIEKR